MKNYLLLGVSLLSLQISQAQFTANSFSQKVDFTVETNPQGTCIGDLNNDNKMDLVVSNFGDASLSVFISNATQGVINAATFGSTFTMATKTPAPGPSNIAIEDLDGDGKNEIILAYGYGTPVASSISIFKNNFSGTINQASFTRSDYFSGSHPGGVCVEDMDLDGKKDILVTNYGSSTVSFFKNNSTLGTLSIAAATYLNTGTAPTYPYVADFDLDGKKDLAVANWTSNSLTIYKNNSSGGTLNLSLVGTLNYLATGSGGNYIKGGDFDKDGKVEILVGNYFAGTVSIFKNQSTMGNISFASKFDVSLGTAPNLYVQAVAVEDFDYDGKTDFGVCLSGGNAALVFKNNYSSGPLNATSFAAPKTLGLNAGPVSFSTGDLDQDFRPDLVMTNFTDHNVSIIKNRNLSAEPSVQASGLSITATGTTYTLGFTAGNGSKRLVLMKAGSAVDAVPADTAFYNANNIFAQGSQIGSGNYVVYAESGTSCTITGLTTGTTYHLAVFEFNGIGGYCNYLTTAPLTGSRTVGVSKELMRDYAITLYPNPSSSETRLAFDLKNAANIELAVTDGLGRELKKVSYGKMPAGKAEILLSNTWFGSAGIYYIHLSIDGEVYQKSLVKE